MWQFSVFGISENHSLACGTKGETIVRDGAKRSTLLSRCNTRAMRCLFRAECDAARGMVASCEDTGCEFPTRRARDATGSKGANVAGCRGSGEQRSSRRALTPCDWPLEAQCVTGK